jgi:hypothetical protein
MATITINQHGTATINMGNGKVVPVPLGYESIATYSGAIPELITFTNGGEWWLTDYRPELVEGLVGDLADGETFTSSDDGTTWTRYGDETLVRSPGQAAKLAA